MKYTAFSYRLYIAATNEVSGFMVLDSKEENRYLIFDWDLSDTEIKTLATKFYTTGLTSADFNNSNWSGGDFSDEFSWFQEADDYIKEDQT